MLLKEYKVSVVFDDWKAEGFYIGTAYVFAESSRRAEQLTLNVFDSTDNYYFLGSPTDIEIESTSVTLEGEREYVYDTDLVRG